MFYPLHHLSRWPLTLLHANISGPDIRHFDYIKISYNLFITLKSQNFAAMIAQICYAPTQWWSLIQEVINTGNELKPADSSTYSVSCVMIKSNVLYKYTK